MFRLAQEHFDGPLRAMSTFYTNVPDGPSRGEHWLSARASPFRVISRSVEYDYGCSTYGLLDTGEFLAIPYRLGLLSSAPSVHSALATAG